MLSRVLNKEETEGTANIKTLRQEEPDWMYHFTCLEQRFFISKIKVLNQIIPEVFLIL